MTPTRWQQPIAFNGGTLAAGTIFVAVSLAAFPAGGGAQAPPDRTPLAEVRTVATIERSVQPDLATVTLQFAAQGGTPIEAGRRLAVRADSLRRALVTLGIPRDSLVSRSRWYWWRGRIETIPLPVQYVRRPAAGAEGRSHDPVQDTMYRAHDAIEVRIRDLSKVGAVLDTAMGRGITDISGVQFTATNVAAAREEALREATVQARRQAEAIAAASGMELGAVLSLSTQPDYRYDYSPVQLRGTVLSGAIDQGSAGTVIVQPSVPVTVTVQGRWALVKKP